MEKKDKTTVNMNNKKSDKQKMIVPMDNIYIQTVFKLFNRYLIEEVTGQGTFADVRLAKLLEEARNNYRVERKAIMSDGFWGKWDETNIELIFMQKTE